MEHIIIFTIISVLILFYAIFKKKNTIYIIFSIIICLICILCWVDYVIPLKSPFNNANDIIIRMEIKGVMYLNISDKARNEIIEILEETELFKGAKPLNRLDLNDTKIISISGEGLDKPPMHIYLFTRNTVNDYVSYNRKSYRFKNVEKIKNYIDEMIIEE